MKIIQMIFLSLIIFNYNPNQKFKYGMVLQVCERIKEGFIFENIQY